MKEQEIENNKARFKSLCKEHIHREGIDNMLDIGIFACKLSRTLIFLGVLRQSRCDYGDLFAGRFAAGSARARAHTYGDCQDEQECCRGFECLFHMIHLIFP